MSPNLKSILELRTAGQHPLDPIILYETASVHDYLGEESNAIPFYVAAIENGLSGNDLRGAYLGLGSTYRTLGMYQQSKQTFLEALEKFPEATEIKVFLAMTLYNLSEHHAATASLLQIIADTTTHTEIQKYSRAIQLYAQDLDRLWE
jgi:tetratricopeptide (TPR) repeat protein